MNHLINSQETIQINIKEEKLALLINQKMLCVTDIQSTLTPQTKKRLWNICLNQSLNSLKN